MMNSRTRSGEIKAKRAKLSLLDASSSNHRGNCRTKSTKAIYQAQQRAFLAFLTEFAMLPKNFKEKDHVRALLYYVKEMNHTHGRASFSGVDRYTMAISALFEDKRWGRIPWDDFHSFKAEIKDLKATYPLQPRGSAKSYTKSQLNQFRIFSLQPPRNDNYFYRIGWLSLTWSTHGISRGSDLVSHQPPLQYQHIEENSDGLIISIYGSTKTRKGEVTRLVRKLGLGKLDDPTCPVKAYHDLLEFLKHKQKPNDFVFRRDYTKKTLVRNAFTLKHAFKYIVNPVTGSYSTTQACRRSGAQLMDALGVEHATIKSQGDWCYDSKSFEKYLHSKNDENSSTLFRASKAVNRALSKINQD